MPKLARTTPTPALLAQPEGIAGDGPMAHTPTPTQGRGPWVTQKTFFFLKKAEKTTVNILVYNLSSLRPKFVCFFHLNWEHKDMLFITGFSVRGRERNFR